MAERDTPTLPSHLAGFQIAAETIIERGHYVVIDEDGFASGAGTSVAATDAVVGRAQETVDNSDDLVGGARSVLVRPGVYRWDNAPADPVTQASVGRACYALADHVSVAATQAAVRPIAGTVLAVDDDGVWVKTGL